MLNKYPRPAITQPESMDPGTPAIYSSSDWTELGFRLARAFGETVAKYSEYPLYQLHTMTNFLEGYSCQGGK